MLSSRQIRWLFSGYLILLLNLGPAMHRAHLLGFHGGDCCSSAVVEPNQECCDCLHHACDTVPLVPNPDDSESFQQQDEDCPFCRFFDQYSACPTAQLVHLTFGPADAIAIQSIAPVFSSNIFAAARGPPSVAPFSGQV